MAQLVPGAARLVLVPFVLDRPAVLAALLGHALAVTAATALSVGLLEAKAGERGADDGVTPT